jgi:hypothetical protein
MSNLCGGHWRLGWLFLAVGLILLGQLNYLPGRLAHFWEIMALLAAPDPLDKARLTYGEANYDLLLWVEQLAPPEATILLVTASPATYGDPSYVLYHRAMYRLAPRSIWWAAPVPRRPYPAWWHETDLSQTSLLTLAARQQASLILAVGFARPPVAGPLLSFAATTHLIFLPGAPPTLATEPRARSGQSWLQFNDPWGLAGLKLLAAVAVILAWGDLLYGRLAFALPGSAWSRRLAMAWLLGCGLISLALFGLLWLGWPLATAVHLLSGLGLAGWLVARRNSRPGLSLGNFSETIRRNRSIIKLTQSSPSSVFLGVLFSLILLAQCLWVAVAAWVSPLSAWDGWVNWAGKANLIFLEQTIGPALYHNPARLPTNMDYPLMLPLLESWFYSWLGQIHEPSTGLIALLFYLALLVLAFQAAGQLVTPLAALGWTALLATTPRLERMAPAALADLPLAALILLSFLLLFYAYNERTSTGAKRASRDPTFISGAAFAAGLLPWLKQEGWLWAGLIGLGWLIGAGIERRRGHLSGPTMGRLSLLYGVIAFGLPALWPLFLWLYGTEHFTFMAVTAATLWSNLPRWPVILIEMAKRMANPYWNFMWLLVGAGLIGRGKHLWRHGWGPAGLVWPVLAYLGLVSLTYLFSRFSPYLAHLNNSVERLLIQPLPLAWWWLVEQGRAAGWFANRRPDL